SFPRTYVSLAVCQLVAKRPDKAVTYATKAIDLDKRLAFAYFTRSQALQTLGKLGEALEDLDACLRLAPLATFAPPEVLYERRGRLQVALGNHTQAIHNFMVARKLNPQSLQGLDGLWTAYWHLERYHLCAHVAAEMCKTSRENPWP